jgi:hypothetical protein
VYLKNIRFLGGRLQKNGNIEDESLVSNDQTDCPSTSEFVPDNQNEDKLLKNANSEESFSMCIPNLITLSTSDPVNNFVQTFEENNVGEGHSNSIEIRADFINFTQMEH